MSGRPPARPPGCECGPGAHVHMYHSLTVTPGHMYYSITRSLSTRSQSGPGTAAPIATCTHIPMRLQRAVHMSDSLTPATCTAAPTYTCTHILREGPPTPLA